MFGSHTLSHHGQHRRRSLEASFVTAVVLARADMLLGLVLLGSVSLGLCQTTVLLLLSAMDTAPPYRTCMMRRNMVDQVFTTTRVIVVLMAFFGLLDIAALLPNLVHVVE
jgi:hypothetical protein